jgi:hypothetical protein
VSVCRLAVKPRVSTVKSLLNLNGKQATVVASP